MSATFTLSGRSSTLNNRIFPPVEINDSATLALIGFDTFNSIPNVNSANNNIDYELNEETRSLQIPQGAYEIEDIEKAIRNLLSADLSKQEPNSLHAEGENLFALSCNKNTLKCSIRCAYPLNFCNQNSIGILLGFKQRLEEGIEHISSNVVNITNINTIRIECNLITGSYINGKLSHTIYEFYPCVPPGFKIMENPSNAIYLPLNKRTIDEISIQIVDQDGNLVSFMDETVTVRLHLKLSS